MTRKDRMMSRRDSTLRAMGRHTELAARESGESFRSYWERVARIWLDSQPEADPALRTRVEAVLRRDEIRRARWPRREDKTQAGPPSPDPSPYWTRRSISLVGDLQRVQEIASSWETDAGWIVRAIEPGHPVDGHASSVVHVDVPLSRGRWS